MAKTVGESVRNLVLRWAEPKDTNNQTESVKHLKYFPDHQGTKGNELGNLNHKEATNFKSAFNQIFPSVYT